MVMFMYWILNFIPILAQMYICITAIFAHINYNFDVTLYVLLNLLGIPIYLLIINIVYLTHKSISYTSSIICMLATILLNILVLLVGHKIKYGVFIGDVPGELYLLLIIIPFIIVLIGMGIFYSIKGRQK